jgi:hypothetical protein
VRQYAQAGARVQIAGVERDPNRAIAEVEYFLPQGVNSEIWVVDKSQTSRWLVDVDATLAQFFR